VILRVGTSGSRSLPLPGFLIVRDRQPLAASAHLTTHARLSDRSIGLSGQVELLAEPLESVPCIGIAGGGQHCFALLADGSIATWGQDVSDPKGYGAPAYCGPQVSHG
jgi:hypothetical protein